jgi:Tfp pilus assembly protein PilF
MARSSVLCLALGLLAPAAGCQLISRENLAAANGETTPANKTELPPKAAAEVCLATADNLDNAGRGDEAIALYEKARQKGGNTPHISRRLALLYEQQENFGKALDEYKQLLSKSPKDADLLNDIGYCYYNQGNWVEAEKYLRQAVAVNSKHARAWINLGMTLAQSHQTAESLEAFTKVVSPAEAQCNLAFIFMTQKKLDEAKAAYRHALTLDPDLALARAALAKLEQPAAPPAPATTRPIAAPTGQSRNPQAARGPEPALDPNDDMESPIDVRVR